MTEQVSVDQEELKECPFCTGGATLHINKLSTYAYFVACNICPVRTDDRAKKETVIRIWNKRLTEIDPIEHERLKRLDEKVKKEIKYYKTTDIKEFIIDDIVNLLEDLYK